MKAPFRLGTSSYIVPAGLVANARYLAGKVQDIELVLFELDHAPADGSPQSNLPSPQEAAELAAMAREFGLSYTVHLPVDLKPMVSAPDQDPSLLKARRAIEATRGLDPWAYVLHLDGAAVRDARDPGRLAAWYEQALRVLDVVAGWAGGWERLALENLEGYPLDFLEPLFERSPVGRCLDIGHLLVDGHDPLPPIERALPRTRVVHLHGIDRRDHAALGCIPPDRLDAILKPLFSRFRGVLTLEVFGEPDFYASLKALWDSMRRLEGQRPRLELILGGARSGKSRRAESLAAASGERVLYVATAAALDEEMAIRIARHRAERPAAWDTLECQSGLGPAIGAALAAARGAGRPYGLVLVDCVTLLVSNLLLALPEGSDEPAFEAVLAREADGLAACFRASACRWIMVSNEVGLGLVPPYPLGRLYRDGLGRFNQGLARLADSTVFMVAGLCLRGEPE